MAPIIPDTIDNCIFCGGSPTNREHVFSRWIHKYVEKKRGKHTKLRAFSNVTSMVEEIGKGCGDIHDWQVKCVCERCNNGWMREMENRAKPILTPLIKGEKCSLTAQNLRIISSWAVLKAMVGECDTVSLRSWSRADLDRMKRLHLPPAKNCWVWIGHFERGSLAIFWTTHPLSLLPGRKNRGRFGETATEFNSATTTQIVGNLLIHVIHTPMKRIVEKFRFSPPVPSKLRPIWPISGEHVAWPGNALGDREADYICSALFNLIERHAKKILAARGQS